MANKFGQDSLIQICAGVRNGVTILEDFFFTAPFKIAKPFYNESGDVMNIMVMAASAGVMEGDCYKTDVRLGTGSRIALSGQSYTKIHRMSSGCATQFNKFSLGEDAFFDYAQKPVIPFAGSVFRSISECRMKKGSFFLYSEILACGREKRGERFAFGAYKNSIRIYYEDELIFLENQMLSPENQNLEGIGYFEGYNHQATLVCFGEANNVRLLERMFNILDDAREIEFGISEAIKCGLVVRILGWSADRLEKILTALRNEVYAAKGLNRRSL